jgi:hypothetical protein
MGSFLLVCNSYAVLGEMPVSERQEEAGWCIHEVLPSVEVIIGLLDLDGPRKIRAA